MSELKTLQETAISRNHSQQDNSEDKGNTSPSPLPRKKREPSEDGYDSDSLSPADTHIKQEEKKDG